MYDNIPVLLQSAASSTELFPSGFLAAGPVSTGLANLLILFFFLFFLYVNLVRHLCHCVTFLSNSSVAMTSVSCVTKS